MISLNNFSGLKIDLCTFGATIVSIQTPDKNGTSSNVILGFDKIEKYIEHANFYLGSTVGRYANRIANAKFSIKDNFFQLQPNSNNHCLHGGYDSLHTKNWELVSSNTEYAKLKCLSKDLEGGFPGNLEVEVLFTLNKKNQLIIDYSATSDKTTHLNLTQHAYFNLSGDFTTSCIYNHKLQLNADFYTPINEELIPTGELKSVSDSPFDFRKPKKICERLEEIDQQLEYANGFDHNFVINKSKDDWLNFVGVVENETSGRQLGIFSTEPGVQFYSGNFLINPFHPRSAFCLETQHFPNSPNTENFPSTLLEKGKEYRSRTVYQFTNNPSSN